MWNQNQHLANCGALPLALKAKSYAERDGDEIIVYLYLCLRCQIINTTHDCVSPSH